MEEAFEKAIYPDYFAFIDQTIQKNFIVIWGIIMVSARKDETEGQEWFEHWRRMNAKMEWQFDPMWVFFWQIFHFVFESFLMI